MKTKSSDLDQEKIVHNQKPDQDPKKAYEQAEKDMERDESMEIPGKDDTDLDEGELARKEGHP